MTVAGLVLVGSTLLTGLTLFNDAVPGHCLVLGPAATDAARIVQATGVIPISSTA